MLGQVNQTHTGEIFDMAVDGQSKYLYFADKFCITIRRINLANPSQPMQLFAWGGPPTSGGSFGVVSLAFDGSFTHMYAASYDQNVIFRINMQVALSGGLKQPYLVSSSNVVVGSLTSTVSGISPSVQITAPSFIYFDPTYNVLFIAGGLNKAFGIGTSTSFIHYIMRISMGNGLNYTVGGGSLTCGTTTSPGKRCISYLTQVVNSQSVGFANTVGFHLDKKTQQLIIVDQGNYMLRTLYCKYGTI